MAVESPATTLGTAAPGFTLRGSDGRMHSLHELRGARGTVVAFICNHCPYVQAVLPRLLRDARALAPLGVHVIAINPNDAEAYPEDRYARMVEIARDWPFPYLHDETQQVARAYDAVCTPDFFGYDAALRLRYRGRLDAGRKELVADAPRELFEAMQRIANGQLPLPLQYPSMGCSIKWRMA
ncbi:thioredoxin family protein [Metallibacterium scheffleri]|uniref:Thioredoxin family protein n=1 Tax=Metallibacterium scheffleri TaxID=993689 RepID=A0A4S3KK62_9GAMM|nr:thioredoxin family protein [Metallibacterium scheffleri]THD09212.1 thioredoxin family protein [Metallibacterium scheffleri]